MLVCRIPARGDRVSAFIELFFTIVIIVIVFGARGIPALGEAIGRMMQRRAKRRSTPPSETTAGKTKAGGTAGPGASGET